MLLEALKKIGLSDKEAAVYLAALQLGSQPISVIAKKAGLNRSTTYLIFDSLKKKGLASNYLKLKVSYFDVVFPEYLVSYVNRLKMDLEKDKLEIEALIPQFLNLINPSTSKPKVSVFEGIDGVKAIFEDTLQDNKEIFAFSYIDKIFRLLGDYTDEYIKKRQKLGVKVYMISPFSKWYREYMNKNAIQLRECRFLDLKKFPIKGEVRIYKNKVAIVAFDEDRPFGVIIENDFITQMFRLIFQWSWQKIEKK